MLAWCMSPCSRGSGYSVNVRTSFARWASSCRSMRAILDRLVHPLRSGTLRSSFAAQGVALALVVLRARVAALRAVSFNGQSQGRFSL